MKRIIEFYKKSNIKEEMDFIISKTPKNRNIIIFLLFLPISFVYFIISITVGYVNLVLLIIKYFYIKKKQKEEIITSNYNNNFNSTINYLLKEIFIEYPKSKSYLIFYNLIKIFNSKSDIKKEKLKFKIFSYLFKRLFYLITTVPFIVVKINCIVFWEFEKTKEWKSESFLASFESFLHNLYLKHIEDFTENVKNFKIKISKNEINFNPPKWDRYFFKETEKYFFSKKNVEDSFSEFRALQSKKELNGENKTHFAKVYDFFRKDGDTPKKVIIYSETKAKSLVDKNGEQIINKLKDSGSINNNLETYKTGPIIADKKEGILTRLPISYVRKLEKKGYSWFSLNDVFLKDNVINLDSNNVLEKNKNETLESFCDKNFNKFDDNIKKHLDVKEKFYSKNKDIIKNMSEKEFEYNLKNDYNKFNKEKFYFFDDFYKKNKNDGFSDDEN